MGGDRAALYPVSLVVAGQACLVVGGGAVAARKIGSLVRCQADVTVVAPEVASAIDELARQWPVTVCRRAYVAGEAAGYRLVVTATGVPDVDAAVFADADAAGVWVNSADDAEHCTFFLPSVHRDGRVSIAVSTAGASPALATWIRRRLAAACGPGLGTLADVLEEARRRVQAQGRETSSVDWQALLDGPLPGLVAEGRIDEARRILDEAVG